MSDTQPLVDSNWLARQPPGSVRIVDLRWALSGPAALEKYRAGHVPGAVYVDMERDLSRPGGPGRHPFPAPEDFARVLGRIGVTPGTHVVVYDDGSGPALYATGSFQTAGAVAASRIARWNGTTWSELSGVPA